MSGGYYGDGMLGLQAYLVNNETADQHFFELPEDIQEQLNRNEHKFNTEKQLRDYVSYLAMKA